MREKIIAEIKRITKANGGNPPGRNNFEKETGLGRKDWSGKYWARWGDALAEAGYAANPFQKKLDLDEVFERFVVAVRHFRREPTTAELEMYRFQNPDFPAYNSVINHFESKLHLFEALRDWAKQKTDYSDVVELLPSNPYIKMEIKTPAAKEGFVYLIQSGAFYKIGRGDQLEKRVKQIKTALPDAAELVHSIRTDDPSGIEAYWHRRFDEKRANGEWFKLAAGDVAAFKRRKYQ